jgi:hypothetical protein
MQRNKDEIAINNVKHDMLKRKVFAKACLLMIETESDSDEVVVNTVLSSFPDKSKISDERTWLPMHFAMALFLQNKISAEDVHMMYTTDVLAMYRLSEKELGDFEFGLMGCTPAHFLCMQKKPNMAMVKYFCIRDPKVFQLCDQSDKCALHLAAQYSESVELLQTLLQIDETMTKREAEDEDGFSPTPIGLLCRRREFPTFHKMVACLIAADSTAAVIVHGIIQSIESYDRNSKFEDHNIYPGSRGERTMILLRMLLDANVDVTKDDISHCASNVLRGELGVAVLSLFHNKDSTLVKRFEGGDGTLPIHCAASESSVDVLKFLHRAYPNSLFTSEDNQNNLLHLAFQSRHLEDMKDKVEYLCNQSSTLIHQRNYQGMTPLHLTFMERYRGNGVHANSFDIKSVIYICNMDETVVMDKWTPSGESIYSKGGLPLHLLIINNPPMSDLSDEGDCLRLFLRIYPASAGIKDGVGSTPYILAKQQNLSTYFMRLLLAADPTIDPVERHNLNYSARRDGMFLAFKALSVDIEPTIWSKIRYEGRDLLARVIAYL